MAVRIRLRRVGSKKNPYYRIVVADARSPRDGRFIETIGHYNPRNKDDLVLDLKKAEEWQKRGAKPTNTVGCLIKGLKEQQSQEKKRVVVKTEEKKTKKKVMKKKEEKKTEAKSEKEE